jgi:lipopolysaccharide export system ATP-binding protein
MNSANDAGSCLSPRPSLVGRGLVKSYGRRRVVDRVEVEVAPGQTVGLLGPNGAGKTTTFYMMVGLVFPQEGSVGLDGGDITRLPMHLRARRGLGYLAQENSAFRHLTVEENIAAILEWMPLSPAQRRQRLEELLQEFHLEKVRAAPAGLVSGGERRRTEIARALAREPRYLLLDEPFTGIDPIAVAELQDIVSELRSRQIGMIITDHNVRETLRITDRSYIIYEGKILTSGTAAELLEDPIARRFYLGERFEMT